MQNSGKAAPFLAVACLTWLTTLCNAVCSSALYFIAEQRFHFTEMMLFGLGLVAGVSWLPAPWVSLRLIRRVSERTVSVAALCTLSLIVGIPLAVSAAYAASAARGGEGRDPGWSMLVLIGLYSFVVNTFWCLNESYLGAGRGPKLAWYTGLWNLSWGSAAVVSFLAISPVIGSYPLQLLASLGIVHLASLVLLVWHPPRPPCVMPSYSKPDSVDESEGVAQGAGGTGAPPSSSLRRLHYEFRLATPIVNILIGGVLPFLPVSLSRVGIGTGMRTAVASTWMIIRAVMFFVLGRWPVLWHGRPWVFWASLGTAMAGLFGCFVDTGLVVVVICSLVFFGLGIGTFYHCAVSYNLEVGGSHVSSTALFEFVSSVGELVGSLAGFLAYGAVELSLLSDYWAPLVTVAVVCGGAVVWALFSAIVARRRFIDLGVDDIAAEADPLDDLPQAGGYVADAPHAIIRD